MQLKVSLKGIQIQKVFFSNAKVVLCRTQIFWVLSEYERQFLSIFEHEHHRALDIWASSEHEHTKNNTFELRASTNTQFSERERTSIE